MYKILRTPSLAYILRYRLTGQLSQGLEILLLPFSKVLISRLCSKWIYWEINKASKPSSNLIWPDYFTGAAGVLNISYTLCISSITLNVNNDWWDREGGGDTLLAKVRQIWSTIRLTASLIMLSATVQFGPTYLWMVELVVYRSSLYKISYLKWDLFHTMACIINSFYRSI